MSDQIPPVEARVGHLDLPATLRRFKTDCAALSTGDWSITDPAANLKLLALPAMRALVNAGVPRPVLNLTNARASMVAIFYAQFWTIDADRRLYVAPQDAAWMRRVAADIYHEARHAEQFFLAARLLAGRTSALSADERAIQAGILASVRSTASSQPLQPTAAERDAIAEWIGGYVASLQVLKDINAGAEQMTRTGDTIGAELNLLPGAFLSEQECQQYMDRVDELRTLASTAETAYREAFTRYVAVPMEQDAYAVAVRADGPAAPDPATLARAQRRSKIDGRFADYMQAVNTKVAAFRTSPPPQPPPAAPGAPGPDQAVVVAVHDADADDDEDLIIIA